MATSSGAPSSGSGSGSRKYPIQNSGSEGDLLNIMADRKRKRMISNRESARRSRMRKRKQLDDLTTQLSQLRKENNQMTYSISITTQHYVSLEAENSVLRTQVTELSHRLQSLNEILGFMYDDQYGGVNCGEVVDHFMNKSMSYVYVNHPILASADMIQY